MTQPDRYFPNTAINADPGFAAYAATTQEDYQDQLDTRVRSPFELIIDGLCRALADNPFAQGLITIGEFLFPDEQAITGKLFGGIQNLADTLCAIITCGVVNPGGTTPATLLAGLHAIIDPIWNNPVVQSVVHFAESIGVAAEHGLLTIFNGLMGFAEAVCSLLTTGHLPTSYGDWSASLADILAQAEGIINLVLNNPLVSALRNLVGDTGSLFYDIAAGAMAAVGALCANPIVVSILDFAESVGVAGGHAVITAINGLMAFGESICSLLTTGALPSTFGSWSTSLAAIVDQVEGIVAAIAANPIVIGLQSLVTSTGSFLTDSINGALSFIGSLGGLLGITITGPGDIIDFFQNAIDGLWGPFTAIFGETGKTLNDLISAITGLLSQISLLTPQAIFQDLLDALGGGVDKTIADVENQVQGAIQGMADRLNSLLPTFPRHNPPFW